MADHGETSKKRDQNQSRSAGVNPWRKSRQERRSIDCGKIGNSKTTVLGIGKRQGGLHRYGEGAPGKEAKLFLAANKTISTGTRCMNYLFTAAGDRINQKGDKDHRTKKGNREKTASVRLSRKA